MQIEIQNKIDELEANRDAVALELDKIDAKIEVLKEMIFAAPSANGALPPAAKLSFVGLNKIQTVQKLIDAIGSKFSSTAVIVKARELDAPCTDSNIYTTIQQMERTGRIRSVGFEGGVGSGFRRVKLYEKI